MKWIATTRENPWVEQTYTEAPASAHKLTVIGEAQTVEGFGGCFNELSYIALSSLEKTDQDKVLDALFAADGCGFNWGRISVGANDYAERWYSYDETPGDYAMEHFSIESIGDMAKVMENKKKMNRLYVKFLAIGIPAELVEIACIVLWIKTGIWWPFVLWMLLMIPFLIWFVRYYHRKVAYICPQCHSTFRPGIKEFTFANHTLRTRKLTCTCCGHKGFCVETWGGDLK